MNNYENRWYMIFDSSELNQIDFSQVLETDSTTVRKSINQSKAFVKWDGNEIPSSVSSLTTKVGPYSHSDILNILKTPEWLNPEPINLTYNG